MEIKITKKDIAEALSDSRNQSLDFDYDGTARYYLYMTNDQKILYNAYDADVGFDAPIRTDKFDKYDEPYYIYKEESLRYKWFREVVNDLYEQVVKYFEKLEEE